jgi:hypothetical protein
MQRDDDPTVLAQLVRRSRLRLRIDDALRVLARGLPLPLLLCCVTLTANKLLKLPPAAMLSLIWLLGVVCVAVLISVVTALTRPTPWQRAALVVDRHFALDDRLTSALEFQRLPENERSALMNLCIEQARELAHKLDARRAVPLRLPREAIYSVLLVCVALVIGRLQVHAALPPPPVPADEGTTFVAEADDLELMRDLAKEWQQTTNSKEGKEVAQRFNQLVMDIAAGKLDRHQVLDRLQALQQSLAPLDADRQAALDEGLKGLARALEANPDTKRLAAALTEKSLNDAEQALRELADKLKNKPGFDRKQLEDLRKALQAASVQNVQRSERLASERAEAEAARERLLKKKRAGDSASDTDAALARQERQLEQLRREQSKAAQTQEQMSELDRQLAEAARQLLQEMGEASQSLQAGADEMGRMGRQQLSEQEKQALKKQLEAMRQMLRQQGKAGESQKARFREFSRRARGQDPAGTSGGQGLRLGPGGAMIAGVPGQAKQSQGSESAQGQASAAGDRPGTGTDPNLKGNANTLQGHTQDVAAAGIDTGQGPSASSVVFGAAERGFAGAEYKRIYSEYQTVAEETLQQDQVPAGYEGHVRRYFQLIRPRD